MEYGGGNSLEQYMKSKIDGKMKEDEAGKVFRQVLEAVKYLEDVGVTHRDIKTENVLLNKYLQVKLVDFGKCLNMKVKRSGGVDNDN